MREGAKRFFARNPVASKDRDTGFGFFGKVPQKGDYLALNLPPAVLLPMEAWLAAALAASRADLGAHFQERYLVAPIWHFWLPPTVLGAGCSGAIVPSVDSGGRYFPATIIYVGTGSRPVPAPSDWDSAPWYEAIDARLLTMLAEPDDAYLAGLLSGLAPPAAVESSSVRSLWWTGTPGSAGFDAFEADGLPDPSAYTRMIC